MGQGRCFGVVDFCDFGLWNFVILVVEFCD